MPAGRRSAPWTLLLTVVALLASLPRCDVRRSSQRSQDDEKLARATCGGCHAFPPPDILPRDRWRDEFVRMMFIRENRLPPIGPPDTVYRVDSAPAGHGRRCCRSTWPARPSVCRRPKPGRIRASRRSGSCGTA